MLNPFRAVAGVFLVVGAVSSQESPCVDLTLEDGSPWHDSYGEDSSCTKYYSQPGKCAKYGDKYAFGGLVANKACCKCGGGSIKVEATSGAPSFTVPEGTVVSFAGLGSGINVFEVDAPGSSNPKSGGFSSGNENSGIDIYLHTFDTAGEIYYYINGNTGTVTVTPKAYSASGRCLGDTDVAIWTFVQPNFKSNMQALHQGCSARCDGFDIAGCRTCTAEILSSAPFTKVCGSCFADGAECKATECASECKCTLTNSCFDDNSCDVCFASKCASKFSTCSGLNPDSSCMPTAGWTHPSYGDTCNDYAPGGKSAKYACEDADVTANCCVDCDTSSCPTPTSDDPTWAGGYKGAGCDAYAPDEKYHKYCVDDGADKACCAACGAGTASSSNNCPSPNSDDPSWKGGHKGTGCPEYAVGGKYHKYCEKDGASKFCCAACGSGTSASGGSNCPSPTSDDPSWAGGYKSAGCEAYAPGAKYHKYCESDGASAYCCAACGSGGDDSGSTCPTPTSDDPNWAGGYKGAGCDKYAEGEDYHKYCVDDGATKACCAACPTTTAASSTTTVAGEFERAINGNGPFPDQGDQITTEELGGVTFSNKKHLQGGFVLYWNVLPDEDNLQVGLLSRKGVTKGWIGLGFSPTGYMAKSDTVVSWINDGATSIDDFHFQNQAQSGITRGKRQNMQDGQVFTVDGRLGMIFKRPLSKTGKGAIGVAPIGEMTNIIYALGPYVPSVCSPFCNHDYVDRYMASVAFNGMQGFANYEINKSYRDEPCQGVAALECDSTLYCYHEEAVNGDNFYYSVDKYGKCVNAEDLGTEVDETPAMPWMSPDQKVFENMGGFEYEKTLSGGFHIMFTVNNKDDETKASISMAVISTRPERQGWIGFAFSANGDMAGSDAIIGWDDMNGNANIGDYYLYGQMTSKVKPNNKQGLKNVRVLKKNGQTALIYERPLYPADSVYVMEGPIHIIYAAGPMPTDPSTLPYHVFRRQDDVAFIPYANSDMAVLNGADEMGLCAGPGKIACKPDFDCRMFPDNIGEIFDARMKEFGDMQQEEASSELGETYDWGGSSDKEAETEKTEESEGKGKGKGGRWFNADSWVGQGMCMKPEAPNMWDMDMSAMMAGDLIKKSEWKYTKQLRWGSTLYWNFRKENGVQMIDIAVENQWSGGYIGIGIVPASSDSPGMVGTNAVVGWVHDQEEHTKVGDYLLYGKLPWEIAQSEVQQLKASSLEAKKEGRKTMIRFSRPLKPNYYGDENDDRVAINPGPMYVIYSSGNTPDPASEHDFGYHRFRDMTKIEFYKDEAQLDEE